MLQISDKLVEAFRTYTRESRKWAFVENINSQMDFAKLRLRQELATANHSNEAGVQVLLESRSGKS